MATFPNLAGVPTCDNHIKEELFLAGLEPVHEASKGEVPYSLVGIVGNWKLRRAWYYWVATLVDENDKTKGFDLKTAMQLHHMPHPTRKIVGKTVRSGGHAGAPSPDEYGAQPVYDDELDEKLLALGYEKKTVRLGDKKLEYVDINVGEMSVICNEGKLNVERYVDCYHIDDQIGLNAFVQQVKQDEYNKIMKKRMEEGKYF